MKYCSVEACASVYFHPVYVFMSACNWITRIYRERLIKISVEIVMIYVLLCQLIWWWWKPQNISI